MTTETASAGSERPIIQLGFSEPLRLDATTARGGGGEDRSLAERSRFMMRVGHRSPHFDAWDGGQIGGTPSWLNPRYIPSAVVCPTCRAPMQFVLQLYAPIDSIRESSSEGSSSEKKDRGADTDKEEGDDDRAYHRTLYVFVCPRCCSPASNSSKERPEKTEEADVDRHCIRVLRAQLPQRNPYYPETSGQQDDDDATADVKRGEVNDGAGDAGWRRHRPDFWNVRVCAVCGVRATQRCPLQDRWFCSREHQKEYRKHSNLKGTGPAPQRQEGAVAARAIANGGIRSSNANSDPSELELSYRLPSLFPLSELVVEEEPPILESATSEGTGGATTMNALFPFQGAAGGDSDEDKEGDDSDADLEQEDLNRILTGKDRRQRERTVRHDATTEAFYDRIHLNGGDVRTQCLRYCRWNDDAVLWMRDENQVRDVPVCQRCGAPRKFEFQLMPQLLYYLQQEDARSSSSHKDNGLSKVKAAMEQAESWIEQAPPELVSPGLVEARDGTARAVQNHLLSSSKSADWGVVAVYTCTGSCNHPASPLACVTAGAPSPELGAYVEEYAWVQPSLDH